MPAKKTLFGYLRDTQIWRSIFRHGYPDNTRNRTLVMLSNVFLHLHPIRIRQSGLRLRYTWCMGGLSFFLFLELTITGVLLMFVYRPVAEYAHADIEYLKAGDVTFGIMRELHRWGAHAMVITVWLHMLRVFMTGAYKPPREFNWSVGVILLVLTLLLSFTGYLLPFDQLAMWAVTVGGNMAAAHPGVGREGPGSGIALGEYLPLVTPLSDAKFMLLGSPEVSPITLNRFYIFHCVAFPLVAAIMIAVHFWRVRKDGGVSGPL